MAELTATRESMSGKSQEMTLQNYLEMTEEVIRKTYLTRLTELQIAPIDDPENLEDDLIDNIKRKYEVNLTFDDMDVIIDGCVEVAKIWIK